MALEEVAVGGRFVDWELFQGSGAILPEPFPATAALSPQA